METSDISAALDFKTTVTGRFHTVLADPPWQFQNRTGKMAPEHKRLNRYTTLTLNEIKDIPVSDVVDDRRTSIYGYLTLY